VIEHLENPRQVFRTAQRLLRPGGLLVLSTPNCHSIRSLVSLMVRGHFAAFGPDSYPAHITPLLLVDLERTAREAGLQPLGASYSDSGAVPGFTAMSWQRLSLGTARGKRFSDNLAFACRRP
jgi:2-polyprenyl-3-methyl-5-hydroxy-6-metoxy-1,4-benzoquinol methylase